MRRRLGNLSPALAGTTLALKVAAPMARFISMPENFSPDLMLMPLRETSAGGDVAAVRCVIARRYQVSPGRSASMRTRPGSTFFNVKAPDLSGDESINAAD